MNESDFREVERMTVFHADGIVVPAALARGWVAFPCLALMDTACPLLQSFQRSSALCREVSP